MHTKWQEDLVKDIRDFKNTDDLENFSYIASVEVSDCNRNALLEQFLKVRDNCKAVLEIGVCRNGNRSFTHVFLENKKTETVYIGVDLENKQFLNNTEKNIHTIQTDSSYYEQVMNYCVNVGVHEFDFILIDGWHSINQVLRDWEYTRWLSNKGIVAFHDTAYFPGPNRFLTNISSKWSTIINSCSNNKDDNGIGFCWKVN